MVVIRCNLCVPAFDWSFHEKVFIFPAGVYFVHVSRHEENLLVKPAVETGKWLLDPKITFLNHGSFGACPIHVLNLQSDGRSRLERQPLQFLVRELETHLDNTREVLAQFIGAKTDDLAFVPNATSGVNTILRSLEFKRDDEVIVTDHEYNACRNALDFVAARSGAKVVVAPIPFPFVPLMN